MASNNQKFKPSEALKRLDENIKFFLNNYRNPNHRIKIYGGAGRIIQNKDINYRLRKLRYQRSNTLRVQIIKHVAKRVREFFRLLDYLEYLSTETYRKFKPTFERGAEYQEMHGFEIVQGATIDGAKFDLLEGTHALNTTIGKFNNLVGAHVLGFSIPEIDKYDFRREDFRQLLSDIRIVLGQINLLPRCINNGPDSVIDNFQIKFGNELGKISVIDDLIKNFIKQLRTTLEQSLHRIPNTKTTKRDIYNVYVDTLATLLNMYH